MAGDPAYIEIVWPPKQFNPFDDPPLTYDHNWSFGSIGDVEIAMSPLATAYSSRARCDYCQQQNKIENFDGGCKNCGAPAPRR